MTITTTASALMRCTASSQAGSRSSGPRLPARGPPRPCVVRHRANERNAHVASLSRRQRSASVAKAVIRQAGIAICAGKSNQVSVLVSSTRLLSKELKVLGMPEGQVEQYLLRSGRSPREGYDNARSYECIKEITKGADSLEDTEALAFVAEELRELWLWKRRKGDYFGGDGLEMYEVALSDIQDMAKKELEKANSEKISSILLDDLNMSDEDKNMLGGAIRGIAVGGIQTIVWNAIGLAVLGLVLINFVGRG